MTQETWLLTGGAGYIGTHIADEFIRAGKSVVIYDSLYQGLESRVDYLRAKHGVEIPLEVIDVRDYAKVDALIAAHNFTGIIHTAALKAVGESMEKPLWYFKNNLNSTLNLLEEAKRQKIKNFIFSSSCTVYGNAKKLPVTEQTPLSKAESPYGLTKQMGEEIIESFAKANPKYNSILLRYFNPGGAHKSKLMGEAPNVALNLVPVITEQAIGKRKSITIFGDDYDTRDGSCVRDYIHVMDLANAHTKAMQYLVKKRNKNNCEVYNLGIGEGATVLEVIKAFEKVSGKKLNYKIGPRREGDVIAIYANYKKARKQLKWKPKRNIEDIMLSAWEWEKVRSKK